MNTRYLVLLSACITLVCLFGCKRDTTQGQKESVVRVRLPNEPDMLNPARSSSAYATQIESHIFLPLAEIDPYDYTLTPLLVTAIPPEEHIASGPDSGGVRFRYHIRPEAKWEDGRPVTGEDYAFTVKMVLNPRVDVAQWRGFLSFISDVQIDEDDARSFVVTVKERYILADLVTCNFNIYPHHIYDSTGYLDGIRVRDLSDPVMADTLAAKDPRLQQFADVFMQARYAKDVITGSGAYRMASWDTGQRIVLERKSDWWGDQVQAKPTLLEAYPQRIIYEIIPDENSALTMLKDASLDILSEVNPRSFSELRSDSAYRDKLQFFAPKLTVYNFLELNNRKPVLSDRNVRRALAHLVDYDGLIDNIALGMAERTIGPIHPDLEYYNSGITPVPFDLDAARTLLAGAGWSDTNGDGTLDKRIGGKHTELILDITVSQRAEGQAVALLFKENAAKVGVGINMVVREGGSALQQDIRTRNFDIMPMRVSSPITLSDPYQTWHSSSDAPGGFNRSGFHNTTADSLCAVIRTSEKKSDRDQAFMALQEVIADEQPCIFLYVPLERIIATAGFEIKPSARKPGYFENLFRQTER